MSITCDWIQRNLPLYVYGELKLDEEERAQAHLDSCPECQGALDKLTAMNQALDSAAPEMPEHLLASARRGLRERVSAVREVAAESSLWSRAIAWLGGPGMIWKPAGALALVALAFYGGRMTERGPVSVAAPGSAAAATRVRFVEADPSGRGVRISLDETRQRLVKGSLEDPSIRQLLLTAARDANDPGIRAESVEMLCSRSGESEIRDALLYAVEHDANAGVRTKALGGLKAFSKDKQTRQVLTRVLLKDSNSGVRTQAIDVLTQTPSQDMVAPLQELMRREDNDYVRMRTQRVLSQMNASPGIF